MKSITKLFLVISLILSAQLMAANLAPVKAAGIIGEQANGYIGFVTKAPADVKQMVNEVNEKRKAKYKQIAKKQKIALSEIEKIAGNKAMAKTKPGNYIKPAGKDWTKK